MSYSSYSCDLCLEEQEDHDEYIKNLQDDKKDKDRYKAERPAKFQDYFENNKEGPDSIFNLPGINFIRYTHKRIKFSFQPSLVARMVSAKIIFIVSLKYRMGYWMVKRDHVPANYKWKIYKIFYTTSSCVSYFRFTDENVAFAVREIWKTLFRWAVDDDVFRKDKRKRYRNGEDVYIDEDDEELFLSEAEVSDLHRRRSIIWRRMLPPPPQPAQRPRRRL